MKYRPKLIIKDFRLGKQTPFYEVNIMNLKIKKKGKFVLEINPRFCFEAQKVVSDPSGHF